MAAPAHESVSSEAPPGTGPGGSLLGPPTPHPRFVGVPRGQCPAARPPSPSACRAASGRLTTSLRNCHRLPGLQGVAWPPPHQLQPLPLSAWGRQLPPTSSLLSRGLATMSSSLGASCFHPSPRLAGAGLPSTSPAASQGRAGGRAAPFDLAYMPWVIGSQASTPGAVREPRSPYSQTRRGCTTSHSS